MRRRCPDGASASSSTLQPRPSSASKPRNEGIVGFTILHAVAAWTGVGKKSANFVAPLPGSNVGIVGEDALEDLNHRLVLKHTVVTTAPEQPDPGTTRQPIAGETAVSTKFSGCADKSAAVGLATIRKAGREPYRPPQEVLELKTGLVARRSMHNSKPADRASLPHQASTGRSGPAPSRQGQFVNIRVLEEKEMRA